MCGECTLCCDLFPVKWLNKPVNSPCIFCNKGCTIHSDKPAECTDFDCMYIQSGTSRIELRPDKCKVIFEKTSDDTIRGTLDAKFEVTEIVKKQIKSFVKQGYTVILGATDFRKPMIWRPTEQILQP
jgi:hypothetical protein